MSETERQAAIKRVRLRARLTEGARDAHAALDDATRERVEADYRRAQEQAEMIIRESRQESVYD